LFVLNKTNIAEIKRRALVTDVWAALGGPPIRNRRSRAWWRDGDKPSVAIYADEGRWRDWAANAHGDVIDLVRLVRQCSFADAVRWLADFAGIDISADPVRRNYKPDTGWRADLRDATYWAMAAKPLAEMALAEMPLYRMAGEPATDPDRGPHTRLLDVIRKGEMTCVEEFRQWRKGNPRLTAAMVRAGRFHNARLQRKWRWLVSERYTNAA
jgi:hypothetical protein